MLRFFYSILCILLITILIVFSGCTEQPADTPQEINTEIFKKAIITGNFNEITADVSVTNQYSMTLTVTSPNNSDGLTYTYFNGKMSVSFCGIKYEEEKALLPQNSIALCFFNSVLAIKEKTSLNLKEKIDENSIFFGNSKSGNFEVTVNKSGEILNLVFLDYGINFEFINED